MTPTIPTLEQKLDPARTAVVVIDVQNDFCHPEGYSVRISAGGGGHNREVMFERLPVLLEGARQAGAFLAFVRSYADPVYQSPASAEALLKIGIYGQTTLEGTWGAEYLDGIGPIPGNPREVEVIKYRQSAFANTTLDMILRSNGIETLLFTGLSTSSCVESSARDGSFADYYVMMVADCCSDANPDFHAATLRKFTASFGEVLTSEDVLSVWGVSEPAVRA